MIPVFQTKFGYPDGNCHAASLASVLEISIEDIPDFGTDDQWYDRFSRWLCAHHAMQPIELPPDDDLPEWAVPRGWHLIAGKSPRIDALHSIVGFAGKPVHDPYPEGNCELETVESYTVFVVLDPKVVIMPTSAPSENVVR